MLSKRAINLAPSPTLALNAKAKELKASGKAVVNLSVGEPDFPTPKHIGSAAKRAIDEGFTHYTATPGIIELRKALQIKFSRDNGLEYDIDQIIVGVGSKQLLYNALQVLVESGDEVLIPTPVWSTYVEQVKLAEGTPVFIKLDPPFKLTAKDVEKAITKKTKALMLNSPNNPSGAMIEESELKKIVELAVENNIFVISDEIYEFITYGKKQVSIASFGKKITDLTITINGFSKSYAMTGWRIGYAGGPKKIIKAMSSIQGQTTSNTSSIGQIAAIEALRGTAEPMKKMISEFAKRRRYLLEEFGNIPNLKITDPEGAFYLFFDITDLTDGKSSSADWCEKLLKEKFVALVPGEAFYADGYVRMSYAASMQELKEGVKRIKEYISHNK